MLPLSAGGGPFAMAPLVGEACLSRPEGPLPANEGGGPQAPRAMGTLVRPGLRQGAPVIA